MFGHVLPSSPQTWLGTYSHFHLSIKFCLHMTLFGNVLLLFIAMTHAGCGLRLCTVTKNRNDIHTQACLGTYYLPPHKHDWARTPISTCQSNSVYTWRYLATYCYYLLRWLMQSVANNYVVLLKIAITYTLRHVWSGSPYIKRQSYVTLGTVKYFQQYFWFVLSFNFLFLIYKSIQ